MRVHGSQRINTFPEEKRSPLTQADACVQLPIQKEPRQPRADAGARALPPSPALAPSGAEALPGGRFFGPRPLPPPALLRWFEHCDEVPRAQRVRRAPLPRPLPRPPAERVPPFDPEPGPGREPLQPCLREPAIIQRRLGLRRQLPPRPPAPRVPRAHHHEPARFQQLPRPAQEPLGLRHEREHLAQRDRIIPADEPRSEEIPCPRAEPAPLAIRNSLVHHIDPLRPAPLPPERREQLAIPTPHIEHAAARGHARGHEPYPGPLRSPAPLLPVGLPRARQGLHLFLPSPLKVRAG